MSNADVSVLVMFVFYLVHQVKTFVQFKVRFTKALLKNVYVKNKSLKHGTNMNAS